MNEDIEHPDPSEVAAWARMVANLADECGSATVGPVKARTTADLIESQAADLSRLRDALTDAIEERGMAEAEATRLREERDALRARTTPPEGVAPVPKVLWALGVLSDHFRGKPGNGMSQGAVDASVRLIEHAYMPPVAPSPDPKDGER